MASRRSLTEWVLDGAAGGLSLIAVPLATSTVTLALISSLWPSCGGVLLLPGWAAFTLSFVALDYVQYWGHRWLHRPAVWPVHAIHHTLARMDGVGALRHSLWEPIFNPATWISGIAIYLLADRSWYLTGIATSIMLDFWRHSAMPAQAQHPVARLLRRLLVTPEAHAMHHVEGARSVNFGTNLIIWDRWHRTYAAPTPVHLPLGIPLPRRPWRLLLWPARALPASASVPLRAG